MKTVRNFAFVVAISALLFGGCATTQQARSVDPSGFLGDYSNFKEGEGDQALLVYQKPGVDMSKYRKVLLEPVYLYAGKESDLGKLDREDRQALLQYFQASVREQLEQHQIPLTTTPGPDVLRMRLALTDADKSMVLLDTVSTIMPIGLAVSTLKRVTLGSDTAVGSAQAEVEVLDSQTNTRLVAAVDKRYGTKALRSKFGYWNHAKEAFDYWAERIALRLTELKVASR